MAEGLPGTNLVSSTWEADPEPSEIQGQPRGLETLSCKKKIPLKHWQASPSCPTFYVPNRQGPETLCPPPSLAQPRLSLLQQLQCLNASPLAAMMGALQCPPFTWMPSPASLSENPDMLRHRSLYLQHPVFEELAAGAVTRGELAGEGPCPVAALLLSLVPSPGHDRDP